MGNIRRVGKIAPIADIDEMPGTEGYDAETGIISPNKKCTLCVFLNVIVLVSTMKYLYTCQSYIC